MVRPFRAAVAEARRQGQLYFAALLPEDRILKAFGAARANWRGWVYTPANTVWVFLSQCLSADHSCRDAVARLIDWLVAEGRRPCSADTGAYCTARGNLPEEALPQPGPHTGMGGGREGGGGRVRRIRERPARPAATCRKRPFTSSSATPAWKRKTRRTRAGCGRDEECGGSTARRSPCPTRRPTRRRSGHRR